MIDVARLKLPQHRDPQTDIGRRVVGHGIHGKLAGWTNEMIVLKVSELEREVHQLPAIYTIMPASECEWEWN